MELPRAHLNVSTSAERGGGKLLATFAGFWLLMLVSACGGIEIDLGGDDGQSITGSGDVISKVFELDGFSELDISDAFTVTVVRSETFSISVEADDNIMEQIEVIQSVATLRVGIASNFSVRSPKTLKAKISMPELNRVDLSGASRLELLGFSERASIEFNISGASRAAGELNGDIVSVDLSGASRLDFSGTALELSLEASGASRADLEDLTVEQVKKARLSGASSGAFTVLDAMDDVNLSGASTLEYSGDPVIGDVNVSGASNLRRR